MAPVFPDLVLALRLDPQWAGMVLSFHTITIALFIPVAGILADTIGKSKVLISSLLAYAFATPLTSLTFVKASIYLLTGFYSKIETAEVVDKVTDGAAVEAANMSASS